MSTNKDNQGSVRGNRIPARASARLSLLILSVLIVSCGTQTTAGQEKPDTRFIDEAFALVLPVTAARIAGEKNPRFLSVADLEASTVKLVELWTTKNSAIPNVVIASPLAAKSIAQRKASLEPPAIISMPSIVVPFGVGGGIYIAAYDYRQAYAAMGKKAAQLTKKASEKGAYEASCGILFQENFMRQKGALDAFIASFSDGFASDAGGMADGGEKRLVVDVLEGEELKLDPVGATKAAIAALTGKKGISVIVLAIDDAAAAEAAAAMVAADGSADIVFMADLSAWGDRKPAPGHFAYGIKGDEKGLARAVIGMSKDIAKGRKIDLLREVPLRFGRLFPGIF